MSSPNQLRAAERPGEAEQEQRPIPQAHGCLVKQADQAPQLVGHQRRLATGGGPTRATNAGAHLPDGLVRGRDGQACGAMGVGDGGQVQIKGRRAGAARGVGQVEGDRARIGGQRAGLLLLAPGSEQGEGRLGYSRDRDTCKSRPQGQALAVCCTDAPSSGNGVIRSASNGSGAVVGMLVGLRSVASRYQPASRTRAVC